MQLNQLKFGHLNHKTYTQEHSGNAYIQPIYTYKQKLKVTMPITSAIIYSIAQTA